MLLKEKQSYYEAENGTGCHLARSAVFMFSGSVCSYGDRQRCTSTGQDFICCMCSFY